MKKYTVLIILFFSAFCGREKSAEPVSQSQHDADPKHQELHLDLETQKEWEIETGEVSSLHVSSMVTLPGVITLNQNRTAHISSYVQGKVVSLSSDLGDEVHKGQVMLKINSPQFAEAKANFLQARAKLNLGRKEYERAKMLFQEKAIDQKEYLRREAEHEKLATEYGALESILHSYGMSHEDINALIEKCAAVENTGQLCELTNPILSIISPVAGTIIFRDVIVGEHVEPQKILFTASDLNILWAVLDAYEKDLPLINKRSKVTVKPALYPEKEFAGAITYISDMIDEKLRTIKIRVEVKNEERLLKPNMYIQGIIENTAEEKKVLAIPEEAIQNLNGEKIVFVQEAPEIFAALPVDIGEKTSDKRIIIKGLEGGERIVIKGAFILKTELTKKSFAHDHVH